MTNEPTQMPEGHRILIAALMFIGCLLGAWGLLIVSEIPKTLSPNQAVINLIVGVLYAAAGYALRAVRG